MKKKGFTLIELLAVIVILAVIALIAVPIVLSLIEKAKKGSVENSASVFVNQTETMLSSSLLNSPKELDIKGIYVFKNGKLEAYKEDKVALNTLKEKQLKGLLQVDNLDLNIKGIIPDNGSVIEINEKGVTEKVYCMTMKGYKLEFNPITRKFIANKDERKCNGKIAAKIKYKVESYSDKLKITILNEGMSNYVIYSEEKTCNEQSCTFTGLKSNTVYNIGLQIEDVAGNSNQEVIKETTEILPIPEIEYNQEKYEQEKEVTIKYEGEYEYRITIVKGKAEVVKGNVENKEILEEGTYKTKDKEIKIKVKEENVNIFASVVDESQNEVSTKVINIGHIDSTNPESIISIQNVTTKSMDVYGTCKDSGSGIKKIEISNSSDFKEILKEETYDRLEKDRTIKYEAKELLKNKEYTYYVRCIDNVERTSEDSTKETTTNFEIADKEIPKLTEWTTSKEITITYKNTNLTNEITVVGTTGEIISGTVEEATTLENGEKYKVTSETIKIRINSNGTIIYNTTDGTNEEGDSISISTIDTDNPTNVTISATASSYDSVTLSLGAQDSGSGIQKYVVYYGTTSGATTYSKTITSTSTSLTGQSVSITADNNSNTYYFFVRAYDKLDKFTDSSVVSKETIGACQSGYTTSTNSDSCGTYGSCSTTCGTGTQYATKTTTTTVRSKYDNRVCSTSTSTTPNGCSKSCSATSGCTCANGISYCKWQRPSVSSASLYYTNGSGTTSTTPNDASRPVSNLYDSSETTYWTARTTTGNYCTSDKNGYDKVTLDLGSSVYMRGIALYAGNGNASGAVVKISADSTGQYQLTGYTSSLTNGTIGNLTTPSKTNLSHCTAYSFTRLMSTTNDGRWWPVSIAAGSYRYIYIWVYRGASNTDNHLQVGDIRILR